MSDYTQSNIDGILSALSASMGIPHELGGAAKAAHAAPPRIEWMFKRGRFERADRQDSVGRIIGFERQTYDVTIVGSAVVSEESLRFRLYAALDDLFSGWASTMAESGDVVPAPDRIGNAAAATTFPVTFRIPVYGEFFRFVTIATTTLQGSAQPTPDPATQEPIV